MSIIWIIIDDGVVFEGNLQKFNATFFEATELDEIIYFSEMLNAKLEYYFNDIISKSKEMSKHFKLIESCKLYD